MARLVRNWFVFLRYWVSVPGVDAPPESHGTKPETFGLICSETKKTTRMLRRHVVGIHFLYSRKKSFFFLKVVIFRKLRSNLSSRKMICLVFFETEP